MLGSDFSLHSHITGGYFYNSTIGIAWSEFITRLLIPDYLPYVNITAIGRPEYRTRISRWIPVKQT
jgi:hypothetical protein